MSDEQKLMSDAKYKQFVVAVDKSLKNFEYSSEWADLISCLGKLNKVIQTYSKYPAIPRKLMVGKRLAQCLHPALPSGVHIKALESYHLILTQIGGDRLAQDLFIYTSGLFPLLSQASMSVKPLLLDLYENHFLPLKKKLYPGLSGFLLALLPGVEEVSEHTERTMSLLFNLSEATDEIIFFSCLWDGVLHSSQVRLPAMNFVITYMSKMVGIIKQCIMGSDTDLMVNALCASFDDSNVLVQRITLDFAISFISFHSTTLSQKHLVKLLTYALGVFLRRDMSLNRRVFQWLLNFNSDGNPTALLNGSRSVDESTNEELTITDSYFSTYAKELLIAAMVILFQNVVEKAEENASYTKDLVTKYKSVHLKPFRILISLLDKPEIGSGILNGVMLEVFRTLYKHFVIKTKLAESNLTLRGDMKIHEEVIKNANLLFNSLEAFFMWEFLGKVISSCTDKEDTEVASLVVNSEQPTHAEMFTLAIYLLDIVLLESVTEIQTEHWPNLLKVVIMEMIKNVSNMELETLLLGISLISDLLSRLSPNFNNLSNHDHSDFDSSVNTAFTHKSPPGSPFSQNKEFSMESTGDIIKGCIKLSTVLFTNFVEGRVLKRNQNMLLLFQQEESECLMFDVIDANSGYNPLKTNSNSLNLTQNEDNNTVIAVVEAFLVFCRYLVQLSCFPLSGINHHQTTAASKTIPDWLQVLISCCCHGGSFDIQAAALSTLFDLINVTLTVHPCLDNSVVASSNCVPLISFESLIWIEKSNLYKVIAESLWNRISPKCCQYHDTVVNLLLRLHRITPSASICEDVINKALVTMEFKELSHWRFSVFWHLSREYFKDDNNKSNRGTRTIDKCMLLMLDSLQSSHIKVRECVEEWLKHCVHFDDIGRILEAILLILLNPTSARVAAIHYAKSWKHQKQTADNMDNDGIQNDESAKQTINEQNQKVNINNKKKDEQMNKVSDDEDQDISDNKDKSNKVANDNNCHESKVVPPHPLLIHKLLYTQMHDAGQSLYALQRILMILKVEGRAFICAAANSSMSVSNTQHQSVLRELLIRHRRVLSGSEFYGSLADEYSLLIRASTAKYLEILLSVCLYFIRSEYHDGLHISSADIEGNFLVQAASAEVLTKICHLLLEIAKDSGKGFSSYINDLMSRSKIQRISLHCLLSTIYAVTGDYRESSNTGIYCMVDYPNLTETISQHSFSRIPLDLQKSLLKLIESIIYLENCIGTENVAHAHATENNPKARDKKNINSNQIHPFEYVPYKPIVSQPMFISATLTALKEKQWMYLHDNWIKLVISCLPKFGDTMVKLIVPVVRQICDNLEIITTLYKESCSKGKSVSQIQLPPDYMLVILNGLTSFCHYCLINTASSSLLVSTVNRPGNKLKDIDDTSSSLFSNLVHAFSYSQEASTKIHLSEDSAKAFSKTRDGLLSILPSILTAISAVWKSWDITQKTENTKLLVSSLPLPIGQPKAVHLSILQLITPIAMNHTVVFLASVADVWCSFRDMSVLRPSSSLRGKDWLMAVNKRFLPKPTADQRVLLEIVQAIRALRLEFILDTSRQVLRQLVTMKECVQPVPLEVCMLQFLYEYLLETTPDDIDQIKASLILLLKESLQLNMTPPPLFVLFGIFNIYVQNVRIPEERRARRDIQDLAQKFLDSFSHVAAASLEGSAWFRRSLQVVTQMDHSSDFENSSHSDKLELSQSSLGCTKNSQYSVPTVLIMAEYLAPMLDLLYLSEEKDKIASSLVYLMYNITPYLKNHSPQNIAGYRACSALLAAISDYQYTLRSWRKDVYELFLDSDFFKMDLLSMDFWRIIIDRLITYDNSVFKDLMQKISLSQSGAINIFANREQEMEQRAQLLKRLSFVIFCGEADQYHQYLPDIQERLAESIRQLQGPFLHEQVFLCFRVLLTRISPNHLVSLWPPVLTELVLVFVHMEHELANAGKPKAKSKLAALESFLGVNGYFKDPNKWLRLYLAVCKLLDFLLILPSDILPHYQVYKWAFTETPGIYCASGPYKTDDITMSVTSNIAKESIMKEHKSRIRHDHKKDEVSKMALLNAPIAQQKKLALKEKQKSTSLENSKYNNVISVFLPYISRIVKLLRKQNLAEESWQTPLRVPGQLILLQSKVQSIYDLMPFFLGVTGELAAHDVDVTKLTRFKMRHVEDLIENDFIEVSTGLL